MTWHVIWIAIAKAACSARPTHSRQSTRSETSIAEIRTGQPDWKRVSLEERGED